MSGRADPRGSATVDHRDVVVIGPGRVGTTLAVALGRAGFRVVAAAGGSQASRRRFADHVAGARTEADPAAVVARGGTVAVTTPDDAIEQVVTDLAAADAWVEGQRVVHLAGSRGLAVLRRAQLAGCRVAACHPAQTVPGMPVDPDTFVGTAWAVTCGSDDRDWAVDLVEAVGGDAHVVPDDRRVLYHAGLTVGSNTVGAAVAVARQLLVAARVDDPAAFLGPLVSTSVTNVLADGAAALTGPVVRGDLGTVASHLQQLATDVPSLAEAYRHLSLALLEQVAPALDAGTRAQLREMLSVPTPDTP